MAVTKKVWLYPYSAEREYERLLLAYVKTMERQTLSYLKDLELLRLDSWSYDLTSAMLYLLELMLTTGQSVTVRLPEIYAQVSQFNDRQWRLITKAGTGVDIGPAASMSGGNTTMSPPGVIRARFGVGVDVYRSEPWLAQAQSNWIASNTALIKSIPIQYMGQVEQIIRSGVLAGESPKSLAEKIQKAGGVTERRATIIARDQIGKANAELTKNRQTDLGITDYTWRTSHDERVRPLHRERDGREFAWDKPPSDGHPGMPVLCRCSASPIFPPAGTVT